MMYTDSYGADLLDPVRDILGYLTRRYQDDGIFYAAIVT
jgi:hypothetical protein